MVHKLHRPSAAFVVTILAVIAIGAGVVAARTSQTVQGPSWGHFSVGFSGRVHVTQMTWLGRFPVWQVKTNPSGWLVLPISNRPLRNVEAVTIIGDVPFDPRGSSLETVWAMFDGLSEPPSADGPSGVQNVTGFAVLANPVFCVASHCRGTLMVSHGGVVWVAQVVTRGTERQAQNFLDSFRPLG